ncbi:GNAT family N-acetyltransferase [Natronobiforma cellulositropha]|uniref:GNAT family N-acetyltransferase n=1 Tax=Natronobiforma cellulositropha TaxID=1679076 RepID=UPI0021D5F66B|nr:GNAT family N-acetyltransferase [Natronobiforma cellulositropha]
MVSVSLVDPDTEVTAIERLLTAADNSFVPPLSSDARAAIARSGDEGDATSIADYLDACLARPMVAAFDGDTLVGFASFHRCDDHPTLEPYTPTTHVDVLVVAESHRNCGVATRLYHSLLEELPRTLETPFVSTKTWSTNHAHLAILERLAFTCVGRVPDDRGPGIDTVYYAREG